jgi:hypothetical protein
MVLDHNIRDRDSHPDVTVPDFNVGNYSDGLLQFTHLAVSTASLSHHKAVNSGQPTNMAWVALQPSF